MSCNYILIAHEVIRAVKSHRKGKSGRIAMKIDMSKAYDRLNWNFVRMAMMSFNFPERWIDIIMACVTSVSYEVMLNGYPVNSFRPKCGLRQGDPLSPYLFVICTEVLSRNLVKAQELGGLRGIRIHKSAPEISHLFFADDSLFFFEGNPNAVHCLRDILDCYCQASGQKINKDKSSIVFSPSCPLGVATASLRSFGIKPCDNLGVYLGAPSELGSSKCRTFGFLIDGIRKRISSWNSIFLSAAGRLTLINSVLSSLSVFLLSVFKIPVSVANKINSMLAHFWWAGSRDSTSIHWCSRNFLSLPKSKGGLGIRNIQCFNQALLAKQAWKIYDSKSSLLSRVFVAKYGALKTDFDCHWQSAYSKGSWIWKGIAWGWELVVPNLAWDLGASPGVKIWSDKWVGGTIPVPKTGIDHTLLADWSVDRLIQEGVGWKRSCLERIFANEWVEKILAVPLSLGSAEDVVYWNKSVTGAYDCKSGYGSRLEVVFKCLATRMDRCRLEQPYCGFFKKLWRLPGPAKWKILLWKILNLCLPLGEEFQKRDIFGFVGLSCPLCEEDEEIEGYNHLFRDCNFVRRFWQCGDLGISVSNLTCCSVQEWICNWLSFLGKGEGANSDTSTIRQIQFLGMLWTIWILRNEARFNKVRVHPLQASRIYQKMVSTALSAWDTSAKTKTARRLRLMDNREVLATENQNPRLATEDQVLLAGLSLCAEACRLIVDASWVCGGRSGAGWVLSLGNRILGKGGKSFFAANSEQAEAYGIREAIKWAADHSIRHLDVWSDCRSVVLQLRLLTSIKSFNLLLLTDIFSLAAFFHCLSVSFCYRSEVMEAHYLAKEMRGL